MPSDEPVVRYDGRRPRRHDHDEPARGGQRPEQRAHRRRRCGLRPGGRRRRGSRRGAGRRRQALQLRSRPEGDRRAPTATVTGARCARPPRGSSATNRSCTSTGAARSTISGNPPSPRCKASASPPGSMLACMCDLIVAADNAAFSNPVLRMSGAGVELLVEPWELGIRQAKEFMLAGEEIDAHEAWRLGLVNKVVPTAELMERTMELAGRIALVPPVTAQVVKASLNHVGELMGKQASWKLPLHGAPLDPQHRHGDRLAGRAQEDGLDERGLRSAGPGGRHPRRQGLKAPPCPVHSTACASSTSAPASVHLFAPACWASGVPRW